MWVFNGEQFQKGNDDHSLLPARLVGHTQNYGTSATHAVDLIFDTKSCESDLGMEPAACFLDATLLSKKTLAG